MLILRRSGGFRSRIGCRTLVALSLGAMVLTITASSASAAGGQVPGAGSIRCAFAATIRFRPPLTEAGGGAKPSGLKTKLSGCTTHGSEEEVARGSFSGHFASSPFSCVTDAETNASISGSAAWAVGYDFGRRSKFENSPIRNDDVEQGSFVGTARVAMSFPDSLASQCASSRGVKSATVTGTLTLGPACGPGSGAVAIFEITHGPMCGGVYYPSIITAGSDGAVWFTDSDRTIGRITTSGAVSLFKLPDGIGAAGITTGSDGALWFTGGNGSGPLIGRMTTSGAVTTYPLSSGLQGPITAGPDGSLWFVNYPDEGSGAITIDRITTSGTVTAFTSPLIDHPAGITAGPDGALWFADMGDSSIGRITTSGTVSKFTSPLITGPVDITAGPDGALWFTNTNSIGRITTSGTVTRYFDRSITNAWSITAGPDGALWFANYAGSPAIGRMTTSGVVTNRYSDQSIQIPFDITAGADGDVWFTNYGSDTIGRITPP